MTGPDATASRRGLADLLVETLRHLRHARQEAADLRDALHAALDLGHQRQAEITRLRTRLAAVLSEMRAAVPPRREAA